MNLSRAAPMDGDWDWRRQAVAVGSPPLTFVSSRLAFSACPWARPFPLFREILMSGLQQINDVLKSEAPGLFQLLSPLGREAFFPPDIPFQAKEAAGTELNGTIGVFTDGAGNALPLPSMESALDFEGEERNRAFLYSPVLGIPAVRDAWGRWQRDGQSDVPPGADQETTRPVVLAGLTHGLSMIADLFGGPGRHLVVGKPFWGNYRQIFGLRTGASLVEVEVYCDRRYTPSALIRALNDLPAGEPVLVMVNFPSNPGGYSPTVEQRRELKAGLMAAAEERPVLVLCDDAYAGLVFAEGVPNRSFFWDLVGPDRPANLIPVKIDGATKEFAFFGGRVAFLTFGLKLSEPATEGLENKIQCLSRATLGSPSATAQMVLLRGLESGRALEEVTAIRNVARRRFDAVQPALAKLDPSLLRPLPFNSGFFVLMELPEELGLDPHRVRKHLIEEHSTGLVAIHPNYLRVALCSVSADTLGEMLRRVEQGVRELAGLP